MACKKYIYRRSAKTSYNQNGTVALQNKPKRTAEVGRTELVVLIEGVTEEFGYRDAPNQNPSLG